MMKRIRPALVFLHMAVLVAMTIFFFAPGLLLARPGEDAVSCSPASSFNREAPTVFNIALHLQQKVVNRCDPLGGNPSAVGGGGNGNGNGNGGGGGEDDDDDNDPFGGPGGSGFMQGNEIGEVVLKAQDWKLAIRLETTVQKDLGKRGAVLRCLLRIDECRLMDGNSPIVRYQRRDSARPDNDAAVAGLNEADGVELIVRVDGAMRVESIRGLRELRAVLTKKTPSDTAAGVEILRMSEQVFQDEAFADFLFLTWLPLPVDPTRESSLPLEITALVEYPWHTFPLQFEAGSVKQGEPDIHLLGVLSTASSKTGRAAESLSGRDKVSASSRSLLNAADAQVRQHDFKLTVHLEKDDIGTSGTMERTTTDVKLALRFDRE